MHRDPDLAHDIRNHLTVAIERLALLEEGLDEVIGDEDLYSVHLEAIAEAHTRIETIVDDALGDGTDGELVSVDLAWLAGDAWRHVETGELDLAIEGTRTITGEPSKLRRLFENVYRNAVEHAEGATTVRIGTTETGFFIADDGAGIPPKHRTSALESGYSTAESNTGLGLAIADRAAEAHGWSIELTEATGGGARIEIVMQP